jgi:hypothetical protein
LQVVQRFADVIQRLCRAVADMELQRCRSRCRGADMEVQTCSVWWSSRGAE